MPRRRFRAHVVIDSEVCLNKTYRSKDKAMRVAGELVVDVLSRAALPYAPHNERPAPPVSVRIYDGDALYRHLDLTAPSIPADATAVASS